MTPAIVMARTRAYVIENYLYARPNASVGDDEELLAGGIIDSVGVIELVEFLQEGFGIAIREDEMTEANLGTVAAIGQFVSAKCTDTSTQAERARPRLAG